VKELKFFLDPAGNDRYGDHDWKERILVMLQGMLGPYQLMEPVGEGSLGRVYKALDTRQQKLVAVKVLHDRLRQDPLFTGVFHRELMMQQRVSHPHLVRYLDGCYEPPVFYMVTQWIDGWTLRQIIKHFGRLPPLVSLCIAWQFAQGLDGLHLHDLVHADLSASNIMIERSGRVFLADFSLVLDSALDSYKNMIIGTPGYYSPEHLSAESVVAASDIYVLGLLIFEMVEGRKIIPEMDAKTKMPEIIQAMRSLRVGPMKCTHAALRQGLSQILEPMLEPMLVRRVNSIEKVASSLKHLLLKFGIQDPYGAVRQFLKDGQFQTTDSQKHRDQDIYQGYKPYSIEDIQLLAKGS
jgi:serine/threonine protein kinase